MKKFALLLVVTLILSTVPTGIASAEPVGLAPAAKSLLIPGWGQYDNGEFDYREGRMKVSAMAGLEIAAIFLTSIVGGTAGYPAVWVGLSLFIVNHAWSAYDAFMNANYAPAVDLSTQAPFEKVVVR